MTNPSQPGRFQPQGVHAYQTGTPPSPPGPPGPASPGHERNTLGIVALVTAVAGLVFAVWEGAYLLGWILLPIAFVLSLVAMFQKGKGKAAAVTALIVSIIGTIAGAVAFLGSAVDAFDDAFNEDVSVVEPSGDPEGDPVVPADPADEAVGEVVDEPVEAEAEPADVEEAGSTTDAGTRSSPHPLGTTIASDDWEVTVTSFTADATDAVLAANQFNEDPDEGHSYALVGISVTRVGAESGSTMEIGVDYVTDQGNVVSRSDAFAVAPDALSYEEMFQGASVSGNVVLMIPDGGAGSVRVSPGWFTDDAFFATS